MVNQDFFAALADLEREKGITEEKVIEVFSNALSIAYKKQFADESTVEVRLDPEKKTIRVFSVKTVVETVENPEKEIALSDAVAIKKSYKVGDVVSMEISTKEDFGRIASQTAKQVIMQKFREIEHENTVSEFEDKEGELLTCTVRRIEDGNVYVELGKNQIEGVILPRDQVPTEKYEVNQKLNVYVKRIKNTGKMSQVMVSRSAAGLVKRLFENEVPEIKQGVVQIKGIAREAGIRTKIAIWSEDPAIDALGACVGAKGARVNAIVAELGGEKIDIIPWSEDPLEYIAKSLSPARVIKVIQLEGENNARVIVPDDKLSLAIGRSGLNARLAVRLTGWKIDVKSESAALADGTIMPEAEEEAEDAE